MPKPKGRGGGRAPGRGKADKKERAIRTDDVYEADEADPDELRHASRYDVRPAGEGPWHPTGAHAYAGGAPWQCMRPQGRAAASRLRCRCLLLCRLSPCFVLAHFLQQVESYEYEMPSDFEDEDIDDEMAFTGAGCSRAAAGAVQACRWAATHHLCLSAGVGGVAHLHATQAYSLCRLISA